MLFSPSLFIMVVKGCGMVKKKLFFVVNPTAGKGKIKNKLWEIINLFNKHEYHVSVHITQDKNDAYEIVKQKGHHFHLIVCSGGDGTMNEVIRAMYEKQIDAQFAYIPTGTTNDFATTMKLSKNPITCAKQIMRGNEHKIDIGTINNISFAYICAFGVFTDVSYTTPQVSKNILGHSAYVLEGMKQFMNMNEYHLTIEHDGEIDEDDFCYGMITNSMSVGGIHFFNENNIETNDGFFECLFIKRVNNPLDLQQLLHAFISKDVSKCPRMYAFKAKNIKIHSETPLDFNVDGEFAGTFSQCAINNNHSAITILK